MNFRVTARDNRAGGGGVTTADMEVNVTTAAGPLLVTSHNSGGTFSSAQTVTWSVAGTASAPVNCANVNILLSTDGGLTFPFVLATNTPNDGSQSVVLPNLTTSSARLKVEAAGNIFFDICNSNFAIVSAAPLVSLDATTLIAENCASTNGVIDPGETVTLNFTLRNAGTADTTNLIVTLLATNGVLSPSAAQTYGVLTAGGGGVTRALHSVRRAFAAANLTAVLHLQDGAA
jgi:hypothetical protein